MADCVLCKVTPILAQQTDQFIIDIPDLPSKHYLNVNSLISESLHSEELKTCKTFTPGARLRLELTEANELLTHKKIWEMFAKSDSPHAIVFNKRTDAEDIQLSIFIENKELPKDWDIILISDTQYILNKRASRILLNSSRQFYTNLESYLKSFEVLKVLKLK